MTDRKITPPVFTYRKVCAVSMAVAFCAFTARAEATVEVNIARVGFPTLDGLHVVRNGQWTPVVVDLSLSDAVPFDGFVRVAQFDGDGDQVFDAVEVHLTPQTGGAQRVALYALPNVLRNENRFEVELRTMEGQQIEFLHQGEPARKATSTAAPVHLSDDDLLILSVSNGVVGRLADMNTVAAHEGFLRQVQVSHLSPQDLPDHWFGLESVDLIRWEGADPDALTERQRSALIEWVRRGGSLLMMAQPSAAFALQSQMDDVLPVLIGKAETASGLQLSGARMQQVFDDANRIVFPAPVPILRCHRKPNATVMIHDAGGPSALVVRSSLDRGTIQFCGMRENDLFSGGGDAVEFYRSMFLLGTAPEEITRRDDPTSLFPVVAHVTSFITSGGSYLAIAALICVVYVAVGTLGLWSWLNLRGWSRHNWSAFGAAALSASFMSSAAVKFVRGVGDRVHQCSVIDGQAGSNLAIGSVVIGLKAGSDKTMDLWLPPDPMTALDPAASPCTLKPISSSSEFGETMASFADPEEYRASPASGVLQRVRMRGTLKQFEGRWRGRMSGLIAAEVSIRERSGMDWRITDESYIRNDLGVNLFGCYLLQPIVDTTAPFASRLEQQSHRDTSVYSFFLGDLPNGVVVPLAKQCYRTNDQSRAAFRPLMSDLLRDSHGSWAKPFRGLLDSFTGLPTPGTISLGGSELNALLILSTVTNYDAQAHSPVRSSWSRDRMRHLDLHSQLQRDSVILVGFSHDPGPIRIFRRYGAESFAPVEPEAGGKSISMYRIRIPATLIPVG